MAAVVRRLICLFMLQNFREDFWTLAREQRGYYSWARREQEALSRAAWRKRRHCPFCCDALDVRELVDSIFEDGLGLHPLLDPVFAAVARAETRFLLRFIPQRSHEERLTGNLVSEVEAALFLARPTFAELSRGRYGEAKEVDFIYYDLSRGGTIETETGADLGFILHIDLPDWPRVIRYAAFQAKKVDGSSQLPKEQFLTLQKEFGEAAAYLFYDMDMQTLLPPMVLSASDLQSRCKSAKDTDSFSVPLDAVDDGLPLSLWLFSRLAVEQAGAVASSFDSAFQTFTRRLERQRQFSNGRLAILSVGRPLRITRNQEIGLNITL